MIKLYLTMFGGGGGGSGGGQAMDNQKKPVKLGDYVTSKKSIDKKNQYVLIDVREGKTSNAPAEYLIKQMDDGNIEYNKSLDMWVSKKGKKYQIRRRK